MSRIYYRGAYAAIACYDVTDPKSWEKLKYWIQEVRLFEQDCKIFIAATKCDLLGNTSIESSF